MNFGLAWWGFQKCGGLETAFEAILMGKGLGSWEGLWVMFHKFGWNGLLGDWLGWNLASWTAGLGMIAGCWDAGGSQVLWGVTAWNIGCGLSGSATGSLLDGCICCIVCTRFAIFMAFIVDPKFLNVLLDALWEFVDGRRIFCSLLMYYFHYEGQNNLKKCSTGPLLYARTNVDFHFDTIVD